MKTVLSISLFAATVWASAPESRAAHWVPIIQEEQSAQQRTPEQRATATATRMTKDLGLTDEQKQKIYDAALIRAQQMDQARSKAGGDRSQMREAMKPANDAFDASAKNILTADQYTKWKADNTKQRQVHRPAGQ